MRGFASVMVTLHLQVVVVGISNEHKRPVRYYESVRASFSHSASLNEGIHAIIPHPNPDTTIVSSFKNMAKAEACENKMVAEVDEAEEEFANCARRTTAQLHVTKHKRETSEDASNFICTAAILRYETVSASNAAAAAVAQYYQTKVFYLQAEAEKRRAEADFSISENEPLKSKAIDKLKDLDPNSNPDSAEIIAARQQLEKIKLKAANTLLKLSQRKGKEKQLDVTTIGQFAQEMKAVANIKIISEDIHLQVADVVKNGVINFCNDNSFFSKGDFAKKLEAIIQHHYHVSCMKRSPFI